MKDKFRRKKLLFIANQNIWESYMKKTVDFYFWNQNFVSRSSIIYADLRITLIPLRYRGMKRQAFIIEYNDHIWYQDPAFKIYNNHMKVLIAFQTRLKKNIYTYLP